MGLRWGLRFVTDVGLAGMMELSWGVVRWPASLAGWLAGGEDES